jgi:hypothetical protein
MDGESLLTSVQCCLCDGRRWCLVPWIPLLLLLLLELFSLSLQRGCSLSLSLLCCTHSHAHLHSTGKIVVCGMSYVPYLVLALTPLFRCEVPPLVRSALTRTSRVPSPSKRSTKSFVPAAFTLPVVAEEREKLISA